MSRQWGLIALAVTGALPALVLRLISITDAAELGLSPLAESAIYGVGILAAATLLVWASEVAETEVSAALALVVLALIAVLPEYAVDLYFAWSAPDDPEAASLAIANMTGANRLLVGLAWPVIFLIFYLRTKRKVMPVDSYNSLGILFLGGATLWSFTIPLRGHLSLLDTAVMFSLFAAYLYISSRSPPEEDRVFVGPAAAIAKLARGQRRLAILGMFVFSATVIFAAAEPFAEGLRHTGEDLGVSKFILIQWVAPLASETPEFLLAGLLAMRGRHDAAMTILISSKVNQWTMLIGSLPLAFSISGGTFEPLDFDTRQSEEVFLTAGQSMFAVAILVSLSMGRWEAAVLAGLFGTQFFFTNGDIRLAYGGLYCALAVLILARDVPGIPRFMRAARDTATGQANLEKGEHTRLE
jgi:cation:H+ antiporter